MPVFVLRARYLMYQNVLFGRSVFLFTCPHIQVLVLPNSLFVHCTYFDCCYFMESILPDNEEHRFLKWVNFGEEKKSLEIASCLYTYFHLC